MYTLRSLNRVKPVQQIRFISNTKSLRESKPTNTTQNAEGESAAKPSSSNPSVFGSRYMVPTKLDRKILVWMKYYKSAEEVPDRVVYETLDKAQNWFRIRCANLMMCGMVVGTLIAVWYGKKRAARGESLETMNIEWHQQMKAEYEENLRKEQEKKKA